MVSKILLLLFITIIITHGFIIPCSDYSFSCQKFNCCKPLICYENTACIYNNSIDNYYSGNTGP